MFTIDEAQVGLSHLLDEVAQGETVVITRNGLPMARLVPPETDEERRARKRAAVDALKEYQRTAPSLGDLSIKEMIEQGRM